MGSENAYGSINRRDKPRRCTKFSASRRPWFQSRLESPTNQVAGTAATERIQEWKIVRVSADCGCNRGQRKHDAIHTPARATGQPELRS